MGRRIRLRYVRRYTDNRGVARCYYRPPHGPQVALPADLAEDDPAFLAAYVAAAKGAPEQSDPRTVDALATLYRDSAAFRALRPTTATHRVRVLDAIRAAQGALPVSGLRARHLRALLDPMTPSVAALHLKVWRSLTRLAVERGWIEADPAREVRLRRPATEGFRPWSRADLAAYRGRWAWGTRERLALELLYETGQRRGDVVRMTAADLDGDGVRVVQSKTGAALWLPLSPELLARLPPAGPLLATQAAAAFTAAGFGNWFRDAVAAAALEGLAAHGLRKTRAAHIADEGGTEREIMAVTGHRSAAEVDRYTRSAEQRRLAMRSRKREDG